jgi:hypothetical protein
MKSLASRIVITIAITVLCFGPLHAQTVPEHPTIEGPITGPGPMHSGGVGGGPVGTRLLADFGYIAEEYFVSGFAGPTHQPYKVRMMIWRPPTPQESTHIVLGDPTHRGGAGLVCQFSRYGIGQRRHICMTAGVRPINLVNAATPSAGLIFFNPARYGTLAVAANQTNEILAQIGWLLKSNHPDSPLASYDITHIVMGGTSDSSDATRAYMGSGHAAFRTPAGGPIYDGFFVSSTLGSAQVAMTDVPTIQMPTQSEVTSTNNYRRPDSDTPPNLFRLYEMSGMSHNDAREGNFPDCTFPNLSQFPHGSMNFLGLQHTIDWAVNGTPPPHAQLMVINTGPPRSIAKDQFGNAQGGVRSTYLDVPAYTYTIPNTGPGLCSQTGYQTRLSDDQLHTLYPTAEDYQSKVETRLAELISERFFAPEYAERYVLSDMRDFIANSGVWTADLTVAVPGVSMVHSTGSVQAKFTATVSNVGTRAAESIAVRFLVDGVPFGADHTIALLHSGASTVVTSDTWTSSSPSGDGTHSVKIVIDSDDAIVESNEENNSNSAAFLVDTTPPAGSLTLSPSVLWPVNNKLVTITQVLMSADALSGPVIVTGPVVTSNEPETGDVVVSGATLKLLASRNGGGTGRVYTVTYSLTDQVGNTSQVSAVVTVPHDQR